MTARKVAMVINTLGNGGVPEAVLGLCRHLPRHRYIPHLFVMKPETGTNPAAAAVADRFAAADIPLTISSGVDGKIGALAELAGFLTDEGIHILHSHSFRPNLYARMAGAICRPSGLRIVAHYHNQYDDKWGAGSTELLLEQQLAGVTDAMVAVSDSVRQHVAKAVGIPQARISVIPNGISTDKTRPLSREAARQGLGLGPGDLGLGLVGRICDQKGQDTFVEAALLLREKLPEAVFLLIGAAEDKVLQDRLRNRIEAAGASGSVHFLGHLTDIAPAYSALDMLVAPSRWEGFGLMLVEAMAAGLPIVATDVGAVAEVTGGAARLVPPDDPAALVAAILSFDAEARATAAAKGRSRSSLYDWKKSAMELAALYERLPVS